MRVLCQALAALLSLATSAPLAAQSTGAPYSALSPSIARQVDSMVGAYMRTEHIPGVSIALSRDGKLVYARGYGMADLENAVPVTTATRFPTASVVKAITATAVLQLAERGKLQLDAPIERYCGAFPAKKWPVTARLLLSHQGGVRASSGADVFNRRHYPTVSDAVRRFADDTLRNQPGTQELYSNEGYTLLACTIEGASGQSFRDYVRSAILDPAGMKSTVQDDFYTVVPLRSRSYMVRTAENTKAWEGLWTAGQLASTKLDVPAVADPVDPTWAPGAGDYLSTPTDMLQFVSALERGALVSDSMRAMEYTNQPLAAGGISTHSAGWIIADVAGIPEPRVIGSVWNGSFAIATLPSRRVAASVASNIEFQQPVELIGALLQLVAHSVTDSKSAR